jgi:hypothetical protein
MAFSRRQAAFLRYLRSAQGTPYVWGGTSLQHGVDCSGLVQRAAQLAGIRNVPRTSQEQFAHGTPVSMRASGRATLIFSNWGSEQGAGHVSVYIGNGHIIEAAGQGIPVRVASISVLNGHILGARRYLAGAGRGLPNVSAFAHQQIQYHAQASGGGGNPAAAAAALQAMRPLQVSPVQQPMQAQTAVQNLIASTSAASCDPERRAAAAFSVADVLRARVVVERLAHAPPRGAEEVPHTAEVVEWDAPGSGPRTDVMGGEEPKRSAARVGRVDARVRDGREPAWPAGGHGDRRRRARPSWVGSDPPERGDAMIQRLLRLWDAATASCRVSPALCMGMAYIFLDLRAHQADEGAQTHQAVCEFRGDLTAASTRANSSWRITRTARSA